MNRIKGFLILLGIGGFLMGCSTSQVRPVEIYPEDNCSHCRMSISDQSFASEIIDQDGEVYKFDDIGCMLIFREQSPALKIRAVFLKDYDSREWIAFSKGTIVQTGVKTPMGSGRVAFSDSLNAMRFQGDHPTTSMGDYPDGRRPAEDHHTEGAR